MWQGSCTRQEAERGRVTTPSGLQAVWCCPVAVSARLGGKKGIAMRREVSFGRKASETVAVRRTAAALEAAAAGGGKAAAWEQGRYTAAAVRC